MTGHSRGTGNRDLCSTAVDFLAILAFTSNWMLDCRSYVPITFLAPPFPVRHH